MLVATIQPGHINAPGFNQPNERKTTMKKHKVEILRQVLITHYANGKHKSTSFWRVLPPRDALGRFTVRRQTNIFFFHH